MVYRILLPRTEYILNFDPISLAREWPRLGGESEVGRDDGWIPGYSGISYAVMRISEIARDILIVYRYDLRSFYSRTTRLKEKEPAVKWTKSARVEYEEHTA